VPNFRTAPARAPEFSAEQILRVGELRMSISLSLGYRQVPCAPLRRRGIDPAQKKQIRHRGQRIHAARPLARRRRGMDGPAR
jgi:hypothetical protein